jgi:S-(hydroxymethyl)glutathione dehydrogenase / alcohol dehydrogenase
MRAAIFHGVGKPLSIETLEPFPPGPLDVVVRITASGLCHSDLRVVDGLSPAPAPMILGHEGTGVVEQIGPLVTRVRPGDRVVGSFMPICGTCPNCIAGRPNLCGSIATRMPTVRARLDGADVTAHAALGMFSDVATCHETSLVAVESDADDAELALIGCAVTTGVGAVLNTARVEPGSAVAVIGCGGVGQAVLQGARIASASQIIAVDPAPLKREVATVSGATDVIDAGAGDFVEQILALTKGRGVDYVFDVVGAPDTVVQAMAACRPGGTTVVIGLTATDAVAPLPLNRLVMQEKKLLGSVYGSADVRREFPRLLALVQAGRLDLGSLVSKTLPLERVNAGYEAMRNGSAIRTVIVAQSDGHRVTHDGVSDAVAETLVDSTLP